MSAAVYATTPDVRVRELRRSSVTAAIGHLTNNDPAAALAIMLAGLEAQAVLAGCVEDR